MRIAVASGLTLLAAGILAATAPGDSVALLAAALALLGLGWNFGLVSGTAMITDAVQLATRAKTQGMVDVSIAMAGATGGLASGLVVSTAGYPVLALTGGIPPWPSYPPSPPPRAAREPGVRGDPGLPSGSGRRRSHLPCQSTPRPGVRFAAQRGHPRLRADDDHRLFAAGAVSGRRAGAAGRSRPREVSGRALPSARR